jgi:TolA-binding protein
LPLLLLPGITCASWFLLLLSGLQVASMESSAADLPALQQQHGQLSAQMEECERLAALNSELRLISHNMEELQQEQVQLKPQAELAHELRRHNQQLEQEAAQLPSIKVRCWIQ